MTTPQHLRGGLYHRAGKRANSSSLSARTSSAFLVKFNPHVHVLAADVTLSALPGSLVAEGFRRAVLEFLVDALSEWLRSRMRGQATFSRKECHRADQEDEL